MANGAPPPVPLQRSSLRQQIADALREEMLTGRMPAGGRFTVKEIAELYEVSATPVREALVDLAAQGLLEVEHHRGFQVRRFTLADFEDVVEARTLVGEGIFRRAARSGLAHVPQSVIASVRRRAQAAEQAAVSGSLAVLVGCDLRFWRELCALNGNRHISDFLDRLQAQGWMFAVPLLEGRADVGELCWRGHLPLVDAVAADDVETARRIVEAYNRRSLEVMGSLAREREPEPEREPGGEDTPLAGR
jgi:DNA-binding GntR family transcriptional regulator